MKRMAGGLILLLTVAACSAEDPRPENLISEETYIDLLVELQLIRTLEDRSDEPVPGDSLRQEIFRKYEVDSLQFEESHTYYQQNLEEQKARIGQAIERLRRDRMIRRDSASRQPEESATEPDTAGAAIPVDSSLSDTAIIDTAGADTAAADTSEG